MRYTAEENRLYCCLLCSQMLIWFMYFELLVQVHVSSLISAEDLDEANENQLDTVIQAKATGDNGGTL